MSEIYHFYTQSVLATVFVIICFLIIRLLIRKQSNILKNILWVVLLFRLLFPFSIYTDLGVLPQAALVGNEVAKGAGLNLQITDSERISNGVSGNVSEAESSGRISRLFRSVEFPMLIWYAGVLLFLLYYAVSRLHMERKIKYARKIPGYEKVYEWEDDFPACVIGVWRPRIYVPHALKKEQLEVIVRHENTHIKRGDYILLVLYFLALALNWYNPLCWVVYFMARSDMEMACDEQALRYCSREERQNYARILVQLSSADAADKFPLVSFAKRDIKRRVLNIGKNYKYKKITYVLVGAAAIVITAAGVFLYANREAGSENKNLAQISLEKSTEAFGADMPRIGYVNENTLMLYDDAGIYVFDLLSNQLVDYVNFKEHGLNGLQGDNAAVVQFSTDGRYIYLCSVNDEVKLLYNTTDRKFESEDFHFENLEFWNGEIAGEDSLENDVYYSVGDIIRQNGDRCFLAIQKNKQPDYGALIYVVGNGKEDDIHALFHADLE